MYDMTPFLICSGLVAVALMVLLPIRMRLEELNRLIRRRSMLERVILLGFLAAFVAYGGTKPPVEPVEPVVEPVVTNKITYVGLESAANPNPTTFTTNDLPLALVPVSREGWTFLGWTPQGGVIPAGTMTNVTFTAQWTAISYSVKFNANGGSGSMADQAMMYDAEKTLTLCAFTRTGYTFAGWATTAGGAVVYANGQTVKNLTATQGAVVNLYAKWTVNGYTIKFNANGGSGAMANESMTYDAEKALTACAFTKKGYTFAGWATSADGAVEYANGATVKNLTATAGGTVTLYAKWTPNNYVIDFNPGQGGTGTMSDQPMMYDEEAALYANLFARTGYTFLGWTDDEGELEEVLFYDGVVVSNLTDEVDGEYDLYAVWTANEYTVRFNANGGEGTMAEMGFRYDEAQSLPMNAFVRTGHAFAGWAVADDGDSMYADGASVKNLTAEANGVVTLYAVWQAGANAVSFDGNGGTPSEASRSVLTDAQIGALPSATRTGWTLVGWFTAASGGTQVSADTVITAAVTFFAQWTANAYSVKFDANGGLGVMADEPMTYDAEKVLTACAFTRKGYTFAGWATSVDGAVEYANGATVKNLTATAGGTVTLYAKWTPNNYVIDFNPGQGGTGTMSDQPMTYDEEKALYANLFARTGYTFLGWTDDEGELEEVLFYDGVVVSNLTDEVDGEYDLYAVWAANEYTVRFNANGGKGAMADQAFLYDEEQGLTSNGFTRAGCDFLGWATSAVGEVAYADGEAVGNLTATADGIANLYAVWDVTGLVDPTEAHIDVEKGEVAPYEDAATVYDGYLYDGDDVVGSIQVKVAKGKVDRKSGVFSSKVTATVQLADGSKKISFKGGVVDEYGNVTGLTAAGHTLSISLGVDGMGGTMDDKSVDGARNVFSAKDADSKAIAAAIEKMWVGTVNVVGDGVVLGITIAKKGKVKVVGTVNGAKVSATSQLLVGDGCCCIPVIITKKANLAFNLWLMADGTVEVRGADSETSGGGAASPLWIAGKAGALKSGAAFRMNGAALARALPGLLTAYLPGELSIAQSGTKWIVAPDEKGKAAKAGKVAINKKTGEIDETKLGMNPSGLKLTYTAKSGSFKGSFKAYTLDAKGKLKSYTVNVTGVMVGSVGYGTATLKKPTVSFPITVE